MSGIVNLNKKRKEKARAAARERAAANSAKHGLGNAETKQLRAERERRERLLDQAKLEEE